MKLRSICRAALCGLALAAAPFFARAAVAEKNPAPLDIPVFTGGYGIGFFEETARHFEAAQPGARVHLYGDPRIADQVRIRVMEGRLPDATDASLNWPALIAAGKVLDLSPFLEGPNWENTARWRDTFLPGTLERWSREGRVYGVPFAYAAWTFFYDKRVFREHGWDVPKTWDEFFLLCEKMRAAQIAPLAFPGVYARYGDTILRAAHYNLAGAAGYEALLRLEPGAFSDPRFVRAAATLQKIARENFLAGWEGMTHTAAQIAFLEGRAGMTLSGSWLASEMREKIPAGFELGAFNFPVFADGIGAPDATQTSSGYYFIFANDDPQRVQATIDFFRFLTSQNRATAFAQKLDSPASMRGVPGQTFSPAMRDVAEIINRSSATYGLPPDAPAFLAVMNQAMADARLKLLSGAITPEVFANTLETAAAAQRKRAENPGHIQAKHPWKTSLLLAVLVAALGWLFWMWRRSRRVARENPQSERGSESLRRLRDRNAAIFVGPALFVYAAFLLVPGVLAFVWAFTRWDGIGELSWVGLENFRWLLLESDVFWQALRNNGFLMLLPAVLIVPLALFFAAAIHRGVFGAGFFRATFLFPNILGGVAAGVLWLAAYEPSTGIANAALVAAGDFFLRVGLDDFGAWLRSFENFAWLSQRTAAGGVPQFFWALGPIYVWLACGFNLVLYLAAMQSVPGELYEAARLDGASELRQFFKITLPLIWETVVISAVFIVIGGLNAFEMVWLLTAQDPASGSHVLGTLMVAAMFKDLEVGRAAAIAVVLFLLVLVGAAVLRRAFRREVVEL